jgi:transcriptional regulator with XRE-family HTH domain
MGEQTQEAFGQWLKKRRKELDLTQEELGNRVGYSAETIRKIEAGKRRPSRHLVRMLAKALGLRSSAVPALIMSARGPNNHSHSSPQAGD